MNALPEDCLSVALVGITDQFRQQATLVNRLRLIGAKQDLLPFFLYCNCGKLVYACLEEYNSWHLPVIWFYSVVQCMSRDDEGLCFSFLSLCFKNEFLI